MAFALELSLIKAEPKNYYNTFLAIISSCLFHIGPALKNQQLSITPEMSGQLERAEK